MIPALPPVSGEGKLSNTHNSAGTARVVESLLRNERVGLMIVESTSSHERRSHVSQEIAVLEDFQNLTLSSCSVIVESLPHSLALMLFSFYCDFDNAPCFVIASDVLALCMVFVF